MLRLVCMFGLLAVGASDWGLPFFSQPQAQTQQEDPSPEEDLFTLTLLHTNDVHARFEEFDKNIGTCPVNSTQCFGGVARRYTKVQELRSSEQNVLLLDAGDQYQGTLWFVYYQGRAAQHFMGRMGYDVMTLGNHEFDRGVKGLVPFLQNVTFPVVNANIDTSKDPRIDGLFNRSVVLEKGGRRIGIVGFITKETPGLVKPDDLEKLKFKDEVTSVQEEVNRLKAAGVNIIIGLSHSGHALDKRVAAEVSGLDVIIGGHTNTFLYTGTPPSNDVPVDTYPVNVQSPTGQLVPVVQAFAYGKYLGHLKVTFNSKGEVVKSEGNPILLDNSVTQDPDILQEIAQWKEPMRNISMTHVGTTLVFLQGSRTVCRLKECNMGNAMADAIVMAARRPPTDPTAWSDISIAFWNSGGIRNSIKQGDITLEDVLSVFPFGNTVSVITMTGENLLKVFEHAVEDYKPEDAEGAFLQVAGIRVTYNLDRPPGDRVVSLEVRCANCSVPTFSPIQKDRVYPMATSDFLISGGDNYNVIKNAIIETKPLDLADFAVFSQYCQSRDPITQGVDGRIFFTSDGVTGGAARVTGVSLGLVPGLLLLLLCFYHTSIQ